MQNFTQDFLTANKWELLCHLARKPQSPTALSQKTKTSLSNITQQLKLLEAYDIVSKEKSKEKTGGKPQMIYTLCNEFVYALMLGNGTGERKYFKIEGFTRTIFTMLFKMSQEDFYYVLKFSMLYEDKLKHVKALGYLKSNKESIELFIITDHVDEIRSKLSNIFIQDANGKTKKIINWSHTLQEVNEGLQRKDPYFLELLKIVEPIHDPTHLIEELQSKKE